MSLKNNDSQELPIKFTRYERACRPNRQATTCHALRLPAYVGSYLNTAQMHNPRLIIP